MWIKAENGLLINLDHAAIIYGRLSGVVETNINGNCYVLANNSKTPLETEHVMDCIERGLLSGREYLDLTNLDANFDSFIRASHSEDD
jgi:hypothetical protein